MLSQIEFQDLCRLLSHNFARLLNLDRTQMLGNFLETFSRTRYHHQFLLDMPHASTGTQHSCPGASGPVTLKNGNVIPAGNCSWKVAESKYRWCTRHENLCKPHDWTYSKKDECKHCQKAKAAAKEEAERKKDEKRKRKRDGDDDAKKTPRRKGSSEGHETPAKKSSTPSTRKTRSNTKKEAEKDKKGGEARRQMGAALALMVG
ncbi:hypothetical protein ONS95_000030 [Cadophora gregata]|uniref:uncharacterized protein n=1 Tax=Cadophora gregata TaxID=51156 RepID=UPI0026DBD942|nr:uncharacterized protein ONS95_000030 [Cadophora gregata]KAK0115704.1 hypothetical protein ONS96_014149 [Cadophora gregata f. sp. sojae]KAK0128044.1 hypothetical protein ONS95_000030 [Cadophora gregata]